MNVPFLRRCGRSCPRVKILDVVIFSIQQIEALECGFPVLPAVPDVGVHRAKRPALHAVIVRERSGPEGADSSAAKPSGFFPVRSEQEPTAEHQGYIVGDITGARAVGEPRMTERELRIHRKVFTRSPVSIQLQAMTRGAGAGFIGSCVADINKLALASQPPKRGGGRQCRNRIGANPQLSADTARKWGRRVRFIHHAAGVVAVKPCSEIRVELSFAKGTDDCAELWANNSVQFVSGLVGVAGQGGSP